MIAPFIFLSLGAAFAGTPSYVSLGESIATLPLPAHTLRLFERQGCSNIFEVRRKLGWALLTGSYPLSKHLARAIRERMAAWEVPDEIAILTREELRFATALSGANIGPSARALLFDHQVRTFAGLTRLLEEYKAPNVKREREHLDIQLRKLMACDGELSG